MAGLKRRALILGLDVSESPLKHNRTIRHMSGFGHLRYSCMAGSESIYISRQPSSSRITVLLGQDYGLRRSCTAHHLDQASLRRCGARCVLHSTRKLSETAMARAPRLRHGYGRTRISYGQKITVLSFGASETWVRTFDRAPAPPVHLPPSLALDCSEPVECRQASLADLAPALESNDATLLLSP